MPKWTKAVFVGKSSLHGPQQGETYSIRVVTPGQLYPYKLLIEELPGCSDEYLDGKACGEDWQLVKSEGAPPA